jgi:hypothetical protein
MLTMVRAVIPAVYKDNAIPAPVGKVGERRLFNPDDDIIKMMVKDQPKALVVR